MKFYLGVTDQRWFNFLRQSRQLSLLRGLCQGWRFHNKTKTIIDTRLPAEATVWAGHGL
jgi:hypothetical protein